MITSINGTVQAQRNHYLVVEVGGIGYAVHVPNGVTSDAKVGSSITLYTHQYIREDSLDLYGFSTWNDLELFEQLISVSGVGPKAGLALLSQFSADQIKESILKSDTSLLTKVSGIGKKTAERLILELKGTLEDVHDSEEGELPATDAVHALEQLGYSRKEAAAALKDIDMSLSVEEQIKKALSQLAR